MSDEIIDVSSEEVNDTPVEKLDSDGRNLPDPAFVEQVPNENLEIEQARYMASQIPEYPQEWQDDYKQDTKGFDDTVDPLKINVSFKEQEMKKIIKKNKRYLKSNITEVKRLESE